mmetsp:Transcript_13316/g.25271  ORF Transcript_13316/g.25271 Transcript_13316/m.25271 type:complete len:242 (-) Transcript_13316:25-750(-)
MSCGTRKLAVHLHLHYIHSPFPAAPLFRGLRSDFFRPLPELFVLNFARLLFASVSLGSSGWGPNETGSAGGLELGTSVFLSVFFSESSFSFRSLSRTVMRATPRRFVPRHVDISWALLSEACKPIPHILSLGAASAIVLSPVAINFSLNSVFCLNLCKFPSVTIRRQLLFHVCSLNPRTPRPSAFCCLGAVALRMSSCMSSSLKSRAFSAIMYCSQQLYVTPSTRNELMCHWLNGPLWNST